MQISSLFNVIPSKQLVDFKGDNSQTQSVDPTVVPSSGAGSVQISTDLQQLGKVFLGQELIRKWEEKGLTVNDEAIDGVVDTMNRGLESLGGKAGSVALNKHQIVMNYQETPDWFAREQQDFISSHPIPEVRKRFSNGDWFVAIQTTDDSSARAISAYSNVMREGSQI